MQENPILSQNEIFLKYFDISDALIHNFTNKFARFKNLYLKYLKLLEKQAI